MKSLSLFFILVFCNSILSQYSLSGKVTNQNGEQLTFTTVYLEGTTHAASTDNNGSFTIKSIPAGEYQLTAKFIGYRAVSIPIRIYADTIINIRMAGEIFALDEIEIQANRVTENDPFTKQNISRATLLKENTGVDVPMLLQWTPSAVVTSDAGTGIGYTSLRIRGSDQTRINVTINGVPLNDAESNNVFWVDLPDLMGSVNSIQIQRGVGTSTNGAGAFGGTVSISTIHNRVNPFIDIHSTIGAFNTRKLSVGLGTGLINNKYMLDGRYSVIKSDGYIDRASADLNSLSFSASRITAKSSLRLNILDGREVTYQAWYGAPESKVKNDQEALLNHYYNNLGTIYNSVSDSVNLFNSDRRYNYYNYQNQNDNYRQTHIQLIHAWAISEAVKTKATLFYTKGKGYYEEFKYNDRLSKYNIPSFFDDNGQLVTTADIVRRRWLDNDLIGVLTDMEWETSNKIKIQAGLAGNKYIGNHFGKVIRSSQEIPDFDKNRNYYDNRGDKTDVSGYLRSIMNINNRWHVHGDLQVRNVGYTIFGVDNDLTNINVASSFTFLNPKFGANFTPSKNTKLYASLAIANKEPSRGDFIDNAFAVLPSAERLRNYELGYTKQNENFGLETNIYYMDYKNQLVLTGELNDVGAPIRINIPESYRLGWETNLNYRISKALIIQTNWTVSRNKIKTFDEIIADYTDGFEKVTIPHENKDISFSPSFIGAIQIMWRPLAGLETELSSKYVGLQYLDNTQNLDRSLPSFHYQNLRIGYDLKAKYWKTCTFSLFINNLLNVLYSSNGYSYTYIYGNSVTENFLYPQAGRHWMLTMSLGF